jgi:hypothetical protein
MREWDGREPLGDSGSRLADVFFFSVLLAAVVLTFVTDRAAEDPVRASA